MKRARSGIRITAASSIALWLCLALSCATSVPRAGGGASASPFPLESAGPSFEAGGLSAFAKASLPSFHTFTLSNGLPVIVKKNSANRVEHISLVIRGGSAATGPESAGIEALALRTMTRGSTRYSREDIQSLLDETSSDLWSASGYDYSTYNLTTLDKYFARLFPVWADTFVAPSFKEGDFDQELSQARLALQSDEQDPWAKTGLEMDKLLFAGHPYAASPEGSEASLAAAKLEDAKAWYAARVRADALFVVAVGDFDPEALRARLEATLGKLPSSGATPSRSVAALSRRGPGSLAKIEYPSSRGIGYLRGDFPAPSPAESDYMPLSIGMKILSDLLFSVVRDKYGAVYSPGADLGHLEANFGSITLFKTKDPGKAKAYIDEAVAVLASGKAVSIDPEAPKGGYSPLSDALEAAKAQFVTELYAREATNASVAGRIAASVISTGDYRSYLLDTDRIRAVTAAQVQAAVDKYLLKGSIAWVALGSADVLASAQPSDFEGFSAKK
jgi:zinc protease